MNKVDKKNLCPMIGMISAGKKSLLNIIFNLDFLETNSGIGTKFVNIIRYIKKAIVDINQKLREQEHCNYEDLFYMIEIGESNLIEDEEYLKNYDLVDIPGVSEFRRPDKNKLAEEKIEKTEENSNEDMFEDEDAAITALVEGEPIIPKKEQKTESKIELEIVSKPEPKKEVNYSLKRSLSSEKKC